MSHKKALMMGSGQTSKKIPHFIDQLHFLSLLLYLLCHEMILILDHKHKQYSKSLSI